MRRARFDGSFRDGGGAIGEKFDLVFIDPPEQNLYYRALKALVDSDRLNDGAIAVCEHSPEDKLPDKVGGLSKYREKKMGKCQFSFYRFESGLCDEGLKKEISDREEKEE
ncbi:MAG: RsmD family RNA methyltransferase [Christensenellales bacterium]